MRKIILLFLTIVLVSCKKEKVDGIIIGDTLFANQSLTENQKMERLIYQALEKEKNAIVEISNFQNGGAAGSYDLGFVLTQIIYRIGEKDFADILRKIPKSERNVFKGLIAVGLEYGDNDYNGEIDNRRLEKEFPELTKILNE